MKPLFLLFLTWSANSQKHVMIMNALMVVIVQIIEGMVDFVHRLVPVKALQ